MAELISDPSLIAELERKSAAAQQPAPANLVSDPELIKALDAKSGVEPKDSGWGTYIKGLVRSAARGATLNWSDEIEALVRGVGGDRELVLARIRDEMDAFKKENPKAAIAAELAGGFAVPGLTGVRVAGSAASLGGRIARGALTGSAMGAASVGGDAENVTGESLPQLGIDMAKGAAISGAIGAAIPPALQVGKTAVRAVATALPDKALPRLNRLKERVALEQIDDAMAADARLSGRTRRQHLDEVADTLRRDQRDGGTYAHSLATASGDSLSRRTGERTEALLRDAGERSDQAQSIIRQYGRLVEDVQPSSVYESFYKRTPLTVRTRDANGRMKTLTADNVFGHMRKESPALRIAEMDARRDFALGPLDPVTGKARTPPPPGTYTPELLHRMDQALRTRAEAAQKNLKDGTKGHKYSAARRQFGQMVDRFFPDIGGQPSLSSIQRRTAIGKGQERKIGELASEEVRSPARIIGDIIQASVGAASGRTGFSASRSASAIMRFAQGDLDKGVTLARLLTARSGKFGSPDAAEMNRIISALERMPERRRSKYLDALIQAESQQVGAGIQ